MNKITFDQERHGLLPLEQRNTAEHSQGQGGQRATGEEGNKEEQEKGRARFQNKTGNTRQLTTLKVFNPSKVLHSADFGLQFISMNSSSNLWL